MALLSPSENVEYIKAKIDIQKPVLDEIIAYCEYANIAVDKSTNDISDFVTKCMMEMINIKDKDWKKFKKESKNTSSNNMTESNL